MNRLLGLLALFTFLLDGDRTRLRQVAEAARESWRRRFTRERWQEQLLAEMERAAS